MANSLQAFFAIFRLVAEWSWDALPSSYRNNPTISVSTSVQTSVQSQNQNPELDAIPPVSQQDCDQFDDNNWITNALDLPTKQVGMHRYNPVTM